MSSVVRTTRCLWGALGLGLAALATGCQTTQALAPPPPAFAGPPPAANGFVPRELCKVVLPTYAIEPPDILMIDAIRIVPRPPYHLRAGDVLGVQVLGTPSDLPIAGTFVVEPGGFLRFSPPYGAVNVAGLTTEEAQAAIARYLRGYLTEPQVSVTLVDFGAKQQISGEHLVGPDGTVTLGSYGSVPVVGLTLAQAEAAIERHLAQYLDDPEVSVDVFAYNSKVYYIVIQGTGPGDGVYRFPLTGNETVLDAISLVQGLSPISSKQIWIARPTDVPGAAQILPVNWGEITALAAAGSNYQILPGDRVFIAEDSWFRFDAQLAKITTPLERIMGFSLLGVGTVTRFSGPVLRGGGNANANF